MIRITAWCAAVAAALVIGFFCGAGKALFFILVLLAAAGAGLNFAAKKSIRCELISEKAVKKGALELSLRIFGRGIIKGVLVSEDIITRERTETEVCFSATVSGVEFNVSAYCPHSTRLSLGFEKLRRYDVFGLTSCRLDDVFIGEVSVKPAAEISGTKGPEHDVSEPDVNEPDVNEPDGSREYAEGDDLRLINHKLTHRFGKPYVRVFSRVRDVHTASVNDDQKNGAVTLKASAVQKDENRFLAAAYEAAVSALLALLLARLSGADISYPFCLAVFFGTVFFSRSLCAAERITVRLMSFAPLVISSAAAAVLHDRLAGELACLANSAGIRASVKALEIFLPFAAEECRLFIVPAAAAGFLSAVSAVAPDRFFSAAAGAVCLAMCVYFSETGITAVLLLTLCTAWLLRYGKKYSGGYAVIVIFTVFAAVFALRLGAFDACLRSSGDSRLSTEIEVVMEDPHPLYLREETEAPRVDENEAVDYSKDFYRLYHNGFYPALQCRSLYSAAGVQAETSKVTVNVKEGELKYPLVTYGAYSTDKLVPDELSIGGDRLLGEPSFYSFEVFSGSLTDSVQIASQLGFGNNDPQADAYLGCESIYSGFCRREYSDLGEIPSDFSADNSVGTVQKLKSIKEYVMKSCGSKDAEDSLSEKADLAELTVSLARYCSIPARLCEGYYIPLSETEKLSQNEAVTVTEKNRHTWAEVYLNRVGWIPLETYPEYANDTEAFDPYGNSGNAQKGEPEENKQSVKTDTEETASAQQAEDKAEKTESKLSVRIFILTGLLCILLWLACSALYRAVRKAPIRSGQPEKAALRAHLLGVKLIGSLIGAENLTPENAEKKLLDKFGTEFCSAYRSSESVYERLLFSQNGIETGGERACKDLYRLAGEAYKRNVPALKRLVRFLTFR